MLNQLRNLVNNHTSEENGKIDIGTIPLSNTTKLMANLVYGSKIAAQLQQYYHSIMDALLVKTYTTAIKEGWLLSFPGLLVEAVHNHLPKFVQSVMDHLHMIRKGIRPTPGDKTVEINKLMHAVIGPDYDGNFLNELPLNQKHNEGVSVFKFDKLNGMISTDQLGWFPTTSARGNEYILVMYCYINSAILATGIKSRLVKDIVKGYDEMYKKLLLSGIIPVLQRIDNETSKDLISLINNKNIIYQIASPGDHRLLPVERAIQTFKNHFI